MCALDQAVETDARRGKWIVRLRRAFPYLVLGLVCTFLLWPCLVGLMPVSHDHPVHLTRAWHFVTQNLAEGRLSGWSDLWLAGWPSGEDYPPGSDWWIAGFFLGTFGMLGWEASYAIAFFAMYAVTAIAFFVFGRAYFGRAAGLLAGLFFLLDRGAYREGGWTFTVEWGVWPQVLSLAFTLLSLAVLDKVVRQARPRDFALCAAFTAFALLSHPVALLLFALGLPVYVAVRGLGLDEDPGRVIVRSLGAIALGGTIAAFWLLPFSAKADWMVSHGRLWKSVEEMAAGIWSGAVFGNVAPVLVWLGVLGAAVAVLRRHWAGIFLAVLMAGLLFLASSTAFVELDLLDLSQAFGQVTYKRLALPIKACLFLLAGFTLQVLFSRASGNRPAFSWRRYAIVGLVSLAAAPFVPAMVRSWNRDNGEGLGQLLTQQDIPYWEDYRQFLRWSADLEKRESDFYRIAYVAPRHDHFFLGAPVYNGTPLYKTGFTPAVMFKHRPEATDRDLLEHLSVKWIVSLQDLSEESYRFERRFGVITVYRFQDYDPQRYTLQGPGRVEVLAFEPADEEIRLRVSGADASSKLIRRRKTAGDHDGPSGPPRALHVGPRGKRHDRVRLCHAHVERARRPVQLARVLPAGLDGLEPNPTVVFGHSLARSNARPFVATRGASRRGSGSRAAVLRAGGLGDQGRDRIRTARASAARSPGGCPGGSGAPRLARNLHSHAFDAFRVRWRVLGIRRICRPADRRRASAMHLGAPGGRRRAPSRFSGSGTRKCHRRTSWSRGPGGRLWRTGRSRGSDRRPRGRSIPPNGQAGMGDVGSRHQRTVRPTGRDFIRGPCGRRRKAPLLSGTGHPSVRGYL
jgi:hypothetical protein